MPTPPGSQASSPSRQGRPSSGPPSPRPSRPMRRPIRVGHPARTHVHATRTPEPRRGPHRTAPHRTAPARAEWGGSTMALARARRKRLFSFDGLYPYPPRRHRLRPHLAVAALVRCEQSGAEARGVDDVLVGEDAEIVCFYIGARVWLRIILIRWLMSMTCDSHGPTGEPCARRFGSGHRGESSRGREGERGG